MDTYRGLAVILPTIGAAANLFLAGLALNRFKSLQKSLTNITFSLFTIFIAIWSLNSALFFVDDRTIDDSLLIKINVFSQAAIATYFFVFSFFFPVSSRTTPQLVRKILLSQVMIVVFGVFLLFDNEVFITTMSLLNTESANITRVTFSIGYIIILSTFFYLASIRTHNTIKHARPLLRKAGRRIHKGRQASIAIALITNIVLPVFGVYELLWVGPVSTSAYLVPLFQDITKYRLLDIRSIIAGSLLYGGLLFAIIVVYSIIVIQFLELISYKDQTLTNITFVASSVLVGMSFQYVRLGIRKIIDAFKFRNRLSPQQSLNKLSKILLKEIETQEIISASLSLIDDTLNPESSTLVVYKQQTPYKLGFRSFKHNPKNPIITKLLNDHNTIVVSEIGNDDDRQALLDKNVDVVIRIYNERKDTNAVLILGPKSNGRPYTQPDVSYLRSFARSVSIAIENSINYERVVNFNETLIAEVQSATRSLKTTNRKLKKLDEDKNEFLSMAAHQLKPQLAAARGFNELLREEAEDEQKQLLNLSSVSIERMVRIVTDMLNLSRFGTSKVELNKTRIDISVIAQKEIERLIPSADNKHQAIISNIEPGLLVYMDEVKIRETIMNFIDNAIYYSPKEGRIYIDLTSENNQLVFSVQDGGMGVPAQDQKQLFRKFYRGSNAKINRPSGTGVGLFIAKKFIDAHNGNVIFQSQENIGSIFGFSVPISNG